MKTRTIQLIQMLLEYPDTYSIKELADNFKVSERMIRNDFTDINSFPNFSCEKIEINQNGRVSIYGDETIVNKVLRNLSYYEYTLSQNERMFVMVLILIVNKNAVTIADCAEFMNVSRATIVKDVPLLREDLIRKKIKLISKPNEGISIEGDERDIRLEIARMLEKDLLGYKRFIKQSENKFIDSNQIEYVIAKTKLIVSSSENETGLYWAPKSFSHLVYYLSIIWIRLGNGNTVKNEEETLVGIFVEVLSEKLNAVGIMMNDEEKYNLSKVIDSMQYLIRPKKNNSTIKTQMVTRKFIEAISKELKIDLNKNYTFYENLSAHLASIFDSKAPKIVEYPEIKELVKRKEYLNSIVSKYSNILELGEQKLTEVEIDYIVIYVSAAVEQLKGSLDLKILVVCDGGVATNQLLKARLKQQLGMNVHRAVSSREVDRALSQEHYDLVISTVPIDHITVDVLKVTPLLMNLDLDIIRKKIDELQLKAISNYYDEEIEVEVLIDSGSEDERIENQKIMDGFLEDAGLTGLPKLSEILTEEYIEIEVSATDWKDAVRKSALPMLKSDDIEERYIDEMIKNIEINGPYVVITKGVAFPHGSYDQGSKNVAMSLIKLKEPVNFGSSEFDPVEIVCALSPIDHNQHLRAFFILVNLLQSKEYKKALFNAKTKEQIINTIQHYERSL